MAVSLFQRLQVRDFDKWLNPDPDELAQMLGNLAAGNHLAVWHLADQTPHLFVEGLLVGRGCVTPHQTTRIPVSKISLTSGLLGVKSLGLKGKTSKSVLTEIVILRILFLSLKRTPSNSFDTNAKSMSLH